MRYRCHGRLTTREFKKWLTGSNAAGRPISKEYPLDLTNKKKLTDLENELTVAGGKEEGRDS